MADKDFIIEQIQERHLPLSKIICFHPPPLPHSSQITQTLTLKITYARSSSESAFEIKVYSLRNHKARLGNSIFFSHFKKRY